MREMMSGVFQYLMKTINLQVKAQKYEGNIMQKKKDTL